VRVPLTSIRAVWPGLGSSCLEKVSVASGERKVDRAVREVGEWERWEHWLEISGCCKRYGGHIGGYVIIQAGWSLLWCFEGLKKNGHGIIGCIIRPQPQG
jgi:hypothetical protein